MSGLRIEAFSAGKLHAAPQANEDRLLILPGRAYAVIDGVSARTTARYDGLSTGQLAAQVVQQTLQEVLAAAEPPAGAALVALLAERLAEEQRRRGVLEMARQDPRHRFAAAMACAIERPEGLEIVLVGDCGVRIDGTRMLQDVKDLDTITATLRQQAWPMLCALTPDIELRESLSRRFVLAGTREAAAELAGVLDAAAIGEIEARALAANRARLPHVSEKDVAFLVRGGIANAQGHYQNNAAEALGYGSLDGTPVPARLFQVHQLPAGCCRSLELFTDGYFAPGDGFGVEAWEAKFRAVEAEDPSKVDLYLSPKGSTPSTWSDDRTYLGVAM